MRNAYLAVALVLATTFLGGCLTPAGNVGQGVPLVIPALIEATSIATNGGNQPDPTNPLCDPADPSPPATCPPSKDEKPR
jgi:hypothetical protein